MQGNGDAVATGIASETLALLIAEVFEVHPEVLENFRLGNPVVLFALKLGDTEYGDLLAPDPMQDSIGIRI